MKVKAFIMIVFIVFFSQTAYAATFQKNDKVTSKVGITFIEEPNIPEEDEGKWLPITGGVSNDFFVIGTIILIVGMIVMRKSLQKKKEDS